MRIPESRYMRIPELLCRRGGILERSKRDEERRRQESSERKNRKMGEGGFSYTIFFMD